MIPRGVSGGIKREFVMRIAVIICGLVFDSQKAFMKGIERKVRDLKDICSVFCCHGNVIGDSLFATGEHMIFNLPDFSKIDGVIFVKNTFFNEEAENRLINEISLHNLPCVCIDRYDPRFVNVTSDEEGSLYVITDHMIKEHDCKKIYLALGHKNVTDTRLRESGIMRAVAENGLEISDKHKYYGNFEYRSGVSAAEYFLGLDEPMADCVICGNDQMAVGVTTALRKAGYKVPQDVKVTGVDYDFVSRVLSPSLTTVKRQQYQKALRAVDILHNYSDYKAGDNIMLPVTLNIGETCGCVTKPEKHNDVAEALAIDRYEQSELIQMVKMMTANFMSATDFDTLLNSMCRYAYHMKPRELYLCLNIRSETKFSYSDFTEKLLSSNEDSDYTATVNNVISCINGKPAETTDSFDISELFPPVAQGGREGVTYYFFPIHYLNRNFGYAIIGESGDLVRNDFFPNWTNICSNAFENIRKLKLMSEMIKTLDKMWIYDTLTGIYNRAGFFKLSDTIVEKCIRTGEPVCVIFLDVDGLKIVNDTYGHDEGDNLIREMGNVMKNVKKHGELLMRYGGDEFVLMAAGYDQSAADECVNAIEREMNLVNDSGAHPFSLEASIGYCITTLTDKEQLNSIIEQADREMYKKKYVKKALKIKNKT